MLLTTTTMDLTPTGTLILRVAFHITIELDKLTVRALYDIGGEQVETENGSGMEIACKLDLNDILHAPSAAKNLAYVYKLTSDNNNVFLEYHPNLYWQLSSSFSRMNISLVLLFHPLRDDTIGLDILPIKLFKRSLRITFLRWGGGGGSL
jgi:hypothetical protein